MSRVSPVKSPAAVLCAAFLCVALWAGPPATPLTAQDAPPRVHLGSASTCFPEDLNLAPRPDGGFVALWSSFGERQGRFLRSFDPHGAALGPEIRVEDEREFVGGQSLATSLEGTLAVVDRLGSGQEPPISYQLLLFSADGTLLDNSPLAIGDLLPGPAIPAVAAHPDGGLLLIRAQEDGVATVRLDAQGSAVAPPVISQAEDAATFPRLFLVTHAVVTSDGDLWLGSSEQLPTSPPSGSLVLQRIAADGDGLGTELQLLRNEAVLFLRHIGLAPQGDDVALMYGDGGTLTLERFESDGLDLGAPQTVTERPTEDGLFERATLTSDAVGNLLLVWAQRATDFTGSSLFVRSLHPGGQSTGPARPVGESRSVFPALQALSLDAGRVVISWGGEPSVPVDPVPCFFNPGPFAAFDTVGGPEALLLQGGRFRVTVTWKTDASGVPETGVGRARPDTDDTGSFWFFDPDNLELTVKVLDGRAVNGHFWVFYGALSDVGYTVTVEDQFGFVARTFENPAGRLASFADTFAFPAN